MPPSSYPNGVLTKNSSGSKNFIYQVINLRARKVVVDLLGRSETGIRIKKGGPCHPGQWSLSILKASRKMSPSFPLPGLWTVNRSDWCWRPALPPLKKRISGNASGSLSHRYQDPLGFNVKFIEVFLKRAFKEFKRKQSN